MSLLRKSVEEQRRYWQERAERVILAAEKSAVELAADLKSVYDATERSINREIQAFYGRYAGETGLSIAEIQKRLSPAELKTAKEDIARYYAETDRLGLDPEYKVYLRSLSARAYMSRLEELKVNIRHEIEKLAARQQGVFAEGLSGTYEDSYYRTVFDIQQGIGVGGSFTALNTQTTQRVIAEKWLGDNYSDRIWENKNKLVSTIETTVPRGMALGQNPKVIARALQSTMETSYYNAFRLARTEFVHIANEAAFEAYGESGVVTRYKFIATLEIKRTCGTCAAMDGHVFKLSEKMKGVNFPVLHPNCRCTTVPYFEPDEIDAMFEETKRAARSEDGKTYYVPADMTYKEWRKEYIGNLGMVGYEVEIAVVENLRNELNKLANSGDGSEETIGKMRYITGELAKAIPELNEYINQETGLFNDQSAAINNLIEDYKNFSMVKAQYAAAEADMKASATALLDIEKQKKKIHAEASDEYFKFLENEAYAEAYGAEAREAVARETYENRMREYAQLGEREAEIRKDQELTNQIMQETGAAIEANTEKIENQTRAQKELNNLSALMAETLRKGIEEYGKALVKEIQRWVDVAYSSFDKIPKAHKTSLAKMKKNQEDHAKAELQFLADLQKMQTLGYDPELISNIASGGLAMRGEASVLAKASKEEAEAYNERNKALIDTGAAIAQFITDTSQLEGEGIRLLNTIRDELKNAQEAVDAAVSVGEDIGGGIVTGLNNKEGPIFAAVRRIVQGLIAAARSEADSHSDSRKTIALGKDIGSGLAHGMLSMQALVADAGKSLAGAATDSISGYYTETTPKEKVKQKKGYEPNVSQMLEAASQRYKITYKQAGVNNPQLHIHGQVIRETADVDKVMDRFAQRIRDLSESSLLVPEG